MGTACATRAATPAKSHGPPEWVPLEQIQPVEPRGPRLRPNVRPCATGRRVLACATGQQGEVPHLLGMAAHGGTIAVAEAFSGNPWLPQGPSPDASRVQFGLYDTELRRVGQTSLTLAGAANDVDLSFVPGGWVVAAHAAGTIEMIWLDERGEPAAPRTVLARSGYPGLAVGPGGEVLVVHVEAREGRGPVMATLVEPRGGVRWSVEVFDGTVEPHFGAQVAADDGGFLVSRRTDQGVTVARVERSGAVGTRHLVATSTEYPSLAWCGAEGRLSWSDFGTHDLHGGTIDRAGQLRGKQHVLGAIPDYFNQSPVLCDGAGSLALLGGYTAGTGKSKSLDLTRVDRESGARRRAIAVLAPEHVAAYDPRMVRLDDRRVAIGWIALHPGYESSQLGLAVVEAPMARRAATQPLAVAE